MSHSTMKRLLKIEIISAEGLKVNRKPLKTKTFCIVRIDEKCQQSKLDELGGSYPIWNDNLEMEMSTNGSVRFISIEVFYRTSGGIDKIVGYAKIPVTDFMGGFAPPGHLNILSYRLRDELGDKCGIINVSIMVKPDVNDKPNSLPSSSFPVDYSACSSQAAAAVNSQMWRRRTTSSSSMTSTTNYGGRVVTGIPVWCVKNNLQSSGGFSDKDVYIKPGSILETEL